MAKIGLNKKGQSSVMDAMFFFVIASSLALFLFVLGSNYGLKVDTQTEKEQFREYVSSASKVILYSSAARDVDCSLEECFSTGSPPEEIDFLMASVKEDFADDGALEETADILKNNIRAIMQPLADSVDFAFYIYMPNQPGNQIPYFLFYKSEFDSDVCNASVPGSGGYGGCHIFYYCKPGVLDAVDNFFISLPGISRTSSKTIFLASPGIPGPQPVQVPSELHFAVWPSFRFNSAPGTSPFSGLDCCDPSIDNTCKSRVFASPTSFGGGAYFLAIGPGDKPRVNLPFISSGLWDSSTVKFVIRNNDPVTKLSGLKIDDASAFDCISSGWVSSIPAGSIPDLEKIESVPKSALFSSPEPFIDHSPVPYSIRTAGADLEWTTTNKAVIANYYADQPDDFEIQLFQQVSISATVQKPADAPSFQKPCKFELSGLTVPLSATLFIDVESPP